jgi:DNA invertase Pin-like site-specific DNA recombinase
LEKQPTAILSSMIDAVSYYRVSTDKQGESRLGLEAQREAVQRYARDNGLHILNEYTEIESGRNDHRPVLHAAIEVCKAKNALLLIAKLDRLGRNVAFISKLMESRVEFIAVDNPHATKLILHVLAAFAEHERDLISRRTKEALKIAKSRGVKLGRNAAILAKANKIKSVEFAKSMKPTIQKIKANGNETIRSIASELNRLKVKTATGKGKWHNHTVYRLLKQIQKLK